ncbi:MAG: hypothetical protein ACRDJE_08585 [Dehalococcoidia bacterium]
MSHRFTAGIALLCFALGAYLCAGCTDGSSSAKSVTTTATPPREPTASATDPSAQLITIERNTQATIGDIRIGAGNFHEEGYTSDDGVPRTGMTAGLWIYVRNDSSKDRHVRVHAGQILSVPGYRLEVVTVDRTAVRLAVSRAEDPP